MSWLYVKAFGVPRGKLDLEVWRILTKEAPTFTSIAIFSTIHLSIAQIMLSKLQSMEAVGIFSCGGQASGYMQDDTGGFFFRASAVSLQSSLLRRGGTEEALL